MTNKLVATILTILLLPVLSAWAADLEGTVQKIDHEKSQIVLNTESGTETVVVNHDTRGADHVKLGDKIKVTYKKQGNKLVAESITPNKGGSPPSPSVMPGG